MDALALKLVIFYFEEPQYFRDDHIFIVEYSSRVTTVFLNRIMDSELKAEFYFIVTCSIQKTNLFSLFD